jgi:hypothetical protein
VCAALTFVFAGPRRESFSIPLGSVFDLIDVTPVSGSYGSDEDVDANSLDLLGVVSFVV